MGYYKSAITKQKRETVFSVGRDDKRKRFHIIFVAKGVEIPIPPELKGRLKEMGFDFSCGIRADSIKEVFEEIQKLLADGYTEEEAPCAI